MTHSFEGIARIGSRIRAQFTSNLAAVAAALALGAAAMTVAAPSAVAQSSQRGQPKTPFSVADFGKLKWLNGTWEATSPGQNTIYQRFTFSNDSTIDIAYFNDPSLSHQIGTGRVYLSVGRIYHTFGSGRWGATHAGSDGVFFVPQVNAHNTFAWHLESPDSWTSTLRSGVSGHDRVTVYQMKRVGGS